MPTTVPACVWRLKPQASQEWARRASCTGTCTTRLGRLSRCAAGCRSRLLALWHAPPPYPSHPSPDSCRSPLRQTIGASFAMKKIEANGRPCNLGIWVRWCLPTRRRACPERAACFHAGRGARRTLPVRSASTPSQASTAGERAQPSSALISRTGPMQRPCCRRRAQPAPAARRCSSCALAWAPSAALSRPCPSQGVLRVLAEQVDQEGAGGGGAGVPHLLGGHQARPGAGGDGVAGCRQGGAPSPSLPAAIPCSCR